MPGRRPVATLLKLVQGTARPSQLKNDRPKFDAPPCIPPGAHLNAAEHAMWDWLMENVVVPGIHGTGDGGSFVKICRLWVRVNEADAKCQQFGLVMRGVRGKPELQPYTRLSRDLWRQLGIALAEVGATPAARVRITGPRSHVTSADPASWDEID